MKRGQVSFEYMILMGFVIMILGVILSVAFYYTGSIQDRIRLSQVSNFANKVLSTAESVYSSGQPSRAIIDAYLPEGVKILQITDNSVYVVIVTSSGENRILFPSKVPIMGALTPTTGIKKLRILATPISAMIVQI